MAKKSVKQKSKRSHLSELRLAFIGGGNMAEALIRGFLSSGIVIPGNICVSDVVTARLDHLRRAFRLRTSQNSVAAVSDADVVILATKPQNADEVLNTIAPVTQNSHLIVSIMAGISTNKIETILEGRGRVVRVMPNTPVLVGKGATGIAGGKKAKRKDLATVVEFFEAVGRAVVVSESQMDAITGLSGSGPAYVALMIEALADGGVLMGLSRDTALMLAAQTFAGTANMVLETGDHPGKLKDMVTSPGGTTTAGLAALEDGATRSDLIRAVEAATVRSMELGQRN